MAAGRVVLAIRTRVDAPGWSVHTNFDSGFAVLVRSPAAGAGAAAHAHATARAIWAHHGAHGALHAAGGRAGRRGDLHGPGVAVGGAVVWC